jgi:uncharacterized membrane protein YdjX (TVP38/TMEM64 family)
MPDHRTDIVRVIASLIAALAIVTSAPSASHAQEANMWTRWARGVTQREYKAEIPFAILVSIPAMVVITPFWAVGAAYGMVFGGGDDDDDE